VRLRVLLCMAFALVGRGQTAQSLAQVKTIFVDSLGQGESPNVIRDKIINRLSSSVRFQVVLDRDKADAVLTGSASESQTVNYSNGNGGSGFSASVVVRLIGKDQSILWASEAKNGHFTRSASSSVADNIVKSLMKAAAPPKSK
jgi:hypothetical protein